MAARSTSLRDILGPNVGIDLAAGSVGGAAQVIIGQPLDTIKTRAQIAPSESLLNTWTNLNLIVVINRGDVCGYFFYFSGLETSHYTT